MMRRMVGGGAAAPAREARAESGESLPPDAKAAAPKKGRVRSLDGLRGVAALVVVFHHSLLTSPRLASAYGGPSPGGLHGLDWALTYTPLHFFWAGTEAVYVFFVLSGFVLTLATESLSFTWVTYYPQRLLRLYLPVIGGVVFAVLTVLAVPRNPVHGASWWLNHHDDPLSIRAIGYNVTLLRYTTFLNSPLWSLKWEVWFSALLPLYVLVGRRMRWHPWLLAIPLLAFIAGGAIKGHATALYLPMFGLGVLMASHRDRLTELGARVRAGAGSTLFLVAILLLTAQWTLHRAFTGDVFTALVAVEAAGAALMVFLVWSWAPARRLGESSPLQWLGVRSFSLYLVHEPIVVSTALLLGGRANALITLAIAVPVSLLGAHLFFAFVEGPSHRLARRVGRRRSLPLRPATVD